MTDVIEKIQNMDEVEFLDLLEKVLANEPEIAKEFLKKLDE